MALSKLKMVVTDLDGTLLNPQHQISDKDFRSLKLLGENKIYRVIATGRSIYSLNRVIPADFPIDYLIFSSGSGILNWNTKKILHAQSLNSNEVVIIANFLTKMNTFLTVFEVFLHSLFENLRVWSTKFGTS